MVRLLNGESRLLRVKTESNYAKEGLMKGLYVLSILFCSPLYFALRQKWMACAVNGLIYLIALLTLLLGIGVVFWLAGVIHAYWDFAMYMREDTLRRQAELIAEKTAQRP